MSKTLVVAINEYFGKKHNQTLQEFAAEVKQLTQKDREELRDMLAKELKEEVEIVY